MTQSEVVLYVYDLTNDYLGSGGAVAKQLFNILPGAELKGIWHSSIVVHGKEIDFGQRGVKINPQGTQGEPNRKYSLGITRYNLSTIKLFAQHLGRNKFKKENYNVVKNNCHCFSDILVQNILKKRIPAFLRNLPTNVVTAFILKMVSLSSHSVPAIRDINGPELYNISRPHLNSLIEPENGKA